MLYNLSIIVVLVMIIFFLSHDKKFSKLFTKNSSLQVLVAIVIAYFSLNRINFGILLVVTVLMVLRYSYINRNVLAPLKDRYETPLIRDIHRIIERFEEEEEEEEETVKNDLHNEEVELKNLFDDLDMKMNSMINK